jgi:hypothetical protein
MEYIKKTEIDLDILDDIIKAKGYREEELHLPEISNIWYQGCDENKMATVNKSQHVGYDASSVICNNITSMLMSTHKIYHPEPTKVKLLYYTFTPTLDMRKKVKIMIDRLPPISLEVFMTYLIFKNPATTKEVVVNNNNNEKLIIKIDRFCGVNFNIHVQFEEFRLNCFELSPSNFIQMQYQLLRSKMWKLTPLIISEREPMFKDISDKFFKLQICTPVMTCLRLTAHYGIYSSIDQGGRIENICSYLSDIPIITSPTVSSRFTLNIPNKIHSEEEWIGLKKRIRPVTFLGDNFTYRPHISTMKCLQDQIQIEFDVVNNDILESPDIFDTNNELKLPHTSPITSLCGINHIYSYIETVFDKTNNVYNEDDRKSLTERFGLPYNDNAKDLMLYFLDSISA